MSELTQCNYCSLQQLRREAKEKGMVVHLVQGTGSLGGIEVYVTPKGEKPDTRTDPDTGNNLSPYWRRWFMKLSDHCVC